MFQHPCPGPTAADVQAAALAADASTVSRAEGRCLIPHGKCSVGHGVLAVVPVG